MVNVCGAELVNIFCAVKFKVTSSEVWAKALPIEKVREVKIKAMMILLL